MSVAHTGRFLDDRPIQGGTDVICFGAPITESSVRQKAAPQLSKLEKFGDFRPVCSCRLASALYMGDMRVSMSTKKALGAGSPIAKRCAFSGHLRNSEYRGRDLGVGRHKQADQR